MRRAKLKASSPPLEAGPRHMSSVDRRRRPGETRGEYRVPPSFTAVESTHLQRAEKEGAAEQEGRSGGERAAACSAVKATPSGRPEQVRAGLDRLRSLPQSVAMIDTSVRVSSLPRLSHAPTSRVGALSGG